MLNVMQPDDAQNLKKKNLYHQYNHQNFDHLKLGGVMKNQILLIIFTILFFTFCGGVFAQNNQIGFIGGVNIANLEEEDSDFSSLTGFGFGAVLDFPLGDKFSLCLQPMYLQKGASQEEDDVTVEMKMAYIEIPILFKFYLGSGDTKPYLMAGPTLGINMSADMEMSGGGMSVEIDVSNVTETLDYGLAFGGGVSFPVGTNSLLFIEAKYCLGLADISKEGEIEFAGMTQTVPDAEVKTSGIQIMAGMTFPL